MYVVHITRFMMPAYHCIPPTLNLVWLMGEELLQDFVFVLDIHVDILR